MNLLWSARVAGLGAALALVPTPTSNPRRVLPLEFRTADDVQEYRIFCQDDVTGPETAVVSELSQRLVHKDLELFLEGNADGFVSVLSEHFYQPSTGITEYPVDSEFFRVLFSSDYFQRRVLGRFADTLLDIGQREVRRYCDMLNPLQNPERYTQDRFRQRGFTYEPGDVILSLPPAVGSPLRNGFQVVYRKKAGAGAPWSIVAGDFSLRPLWNVQDIYAWSK